MEENMDFIYNSDFAKTYAKQYCIKMFILYSFFSIIALFSIYLTIYTFENNIFILMSTALCAVLGLIIGIILLYKKETKEFISFKLVINDEIIEIKSNSLKKIIKINQIKNIFIDNDGNLFIKISKFNDIKIMKYVLNKTELENILSNIKTIETINNKITFIQYLPSFFFIGIFFINRMRILPLYFIFTSGIIISSIFSSIIFLNGAYKKRIKIGNIIINFILIIFFTYGLFSTIRYLIDK
jgi:hypothetical protein